MGEGQGSHQMIDARSEKNIATLHPKVQGSFRKCLLALQEYFKEKGITPKYIAGNRTWAEQDAIYAQGRTKPGPIVSKARGGESRHNFGLAVDVGLFTPDGKYLADSSFYDHIGRIVALQPELEWGGTWKFVDTPHIEYRTGKTLAQLRELHAKGKSVV